MPAHRANLDYVLTCLIPIHIIQSPLYVNYPIICFEFIYTTHLKDVAEAATDIYTTHLKDVAEAATDIYTTHLKDVGEAATDISRFS